MPGPGKKQISRPTTPTSLSCRGHVCHMSPHQPARQRAEPHVTPPTRQREFPLRRSRRVAPPVENVPMALGAGVPYVAAALACLSFLKGKSMSFIRSLPSTEPRVTLPQLKSSQPAALSWLSGAGWSDETTAMRFIKWQVFTCSSEAGTGVGPGLPCMSQTYTGVWKGLFSN